MQSQSLTDTRIDWPPLSELAHVLLLQDYNTRVVIIGVSLLGLAAGLIGSFLLLRKRALLGDALSHATLPGIGIAFLLMTATGGDGKSLPGLLLGAAVSGVLGILCILAIVHASRIKEDAALGIVLSVFFGAGVAVLGIIQSVGAGNAAGLKSFIYGKTASMLLSDAWLIAITAALVTLICAVLFKEFSLLCFDAPFARTLGMPIRTLDVLMMSVVVAVTVIGLQAVGLILVIALLVIPAAAARFWTHHLPSMLVIAGAIGALSGFFGAAFSALLPRMPAGAIIVIVSAVFFAISMVLGAARGVAYGWWQHRRLNARVARDHLLRALHERVESSAQAGETLPPTSADLLGMRSWSPRSLRRTILSAEHDGLLLYRSASDAIMVTDAGRRAAWRAARNHRLWELYLIAHADVAASHVDRDADEVEHVLDPQLIAELEQQLAHRFPNLLDPPSPHVLVDSAAARTPAQGVR